MSDLVTPTLTAVIDRLQSDAGVCALLGTPARVFSRRPTAATFPYLVISGVESRDAGAKGLQAQSLRFDMEIFHTGSGDAAVRQVLVAVRDCLHDAALSGVARCQEEFATVIGVADGLRALARYRLVVSS